MKYDFNENEHNVYKYLIRTDISNKSAETIAKELFVSRTTIYRVCNKMGYKSFSHFKFSKETQEKVKEEKKMTEVSIDDLLKMTHSGDLEKIMDEIIMAERIFVLATQATCFASNYFSRQLVNLGFFAVALRDEFEFLEYKKLFKEKDLLICISNSGENDLINNNVKDIKTKIISLTKEKSLLEKLSYYSITFDFTNYKAENSFDRENIFPIFVIIQKILINLKEI